jgi:hypothetical protein
MTRAQPITVEDVIRAARIKEGVRLPAIGGRAFFTVRVTGDGKLAFTPESTKIERNATTMRRLEEAVAIYNRTGSLKIPDYKSTKSFNLSYILRLIALAADPTWLDWDLEWVPGQKPTPRS